MGSLAQSRRFAVSSHALKEMRTLFTADRADEQESAATIRAWMREADYCVDPHTAVGLAVAEKETRDPSVPMVVLADRASGEISRCGGGRLRNQAGFARLACRSAGAAGARHRAGGRSGGGGTLRGAGLARRA